MQIDPSTAHDAARVYEELKFWLPVVTGLGILYKVSGWLKNLATKTDLQAQTTAIVSELAKIREDFRLVLSPPPRLARARSAKKKIDTVFEHHV